MKILKSIIVFALLISASFASKACGNYYYMPDLPLEKGNVDLSRIFFSKSEELPYWTNGSNFQIMESNNDKSYLLIDKKIVSNNDLTNVNALIKAAQIGKNYELISDYALELLKTQKTKLGLEILQGLIKLYPNEYNINANLGTAYELNGENKMALKYIKNGLQLNPKSHYGSEWMHVKILENKISKEEPVTYKNFFTGEENSSLSYLGITENAGSTIINKTLVEDTIKQMAYQLHERIFFIAPPNEQVSALVSSFAAYVAKARGYKAAIPFYHFSTKYNPENFSNNQYAMNTFTANEYSIAKIKNTNFTKELLLVCGLLFLMLAWCLVSRRKKAVEFAK